MKHPLFFLLAGCIMQMENRQEKFQRWVGDLFFDANVDDEGFQLCFEDHNVFQYFNLSQGMQYKGEKTAIKNAFEKNYQPVTSDQ